MKLNLDQDFEEGWLQERKEGSNVAPPMCS